MQEAVALVFDTYVALNKIITWFHVPNETGTKCGYGLIKLREKLGVKAGVFDNVIQLLDHTVVYVEVKHAPNRLTNNQKNFKSRLDKFAAPNEQLIAHTPSEAVNLAHKIMKKYTK